MRSLKTPACWSTRLTCLARRAWKAPKWSVLHTCATGVTIVGKRASVCGYGKDRASALRGSSARVLGCWPCPRSTSSPPPRAQTHSVRCMVRQRMHVHKSVPVPFGHFPFCLVRQRLHIMRQSRWCSHKNPLFFHVNVDLGF